MADPKITDNDTGEISATVNGKEVRGWSYKDDGERRIKMLAAHEFAEGWFQAREALKARIGTNLNSKLVEMKEGEDDSIVGFNEAWDVVRKIFD